jgi:glycosyltransferase involved in cell wall biosynthesis
MRKEKNILIVSHNRGGGSERCVQEEIQRLTAQGMGIFLLRPMRKNPTQVTIGHPAIRSFPNLKPFGLADVTSLKAALSELRITEVHTHSLVDFVSEAPIHLNELIKKLGVQWKIYLHDYKVICPRINLIDEKGFYCGEPPEEGCNQCLMERGSDFNITDIHTWRAHHKQALLAANKVVVPDQDIADRLSRYFPGVDFEVTPHEAIDPVSVQILKPQIMPNEKLRVVILGAISHIKGFHVIISCAKHVKKNNLPIEFIILGYSMNDKSMEKAGVQITGKYQEHEALEKLKKLNPHVVWLPSTWPETYSYTLSLAIKAHLPVFAFDIGAIARRCKEYGMEDLLMPLQWASIPANITQKFEQFRVFCRHLDS